MFTFVFTRLFRYNSIVDINYSEILDEVKNVLNEANPKLKGFYEGLASNLVCFSKSDFCGVYFLDAVFLVQKALYLNGKLEKQQYQGFFNDKAVAKIIDAKEEYSQIKSDEFFERGFAQFKDGNVLILKLSINGSLFGFTVLVRNEGFSPAEIKALCTLNAAYSYAIKDCELSDVFKLQLHALQNAVLEKEQAKKTIETQHKKLLELDKIKNNFLANISHELRTPLNAIIGFSQALDCRIFGELNEKQAEYIKDIHTSSLHLLNIINEILDISKIESKVMKLNLTNIMPEVLINEVIAILSPLSNKKSIKVVFENGYHGKLEADYQKFQQILYNLLSNAIKFTNKNGKIVVRTRLEGKKFILEIQDNGVGIDKKYHNKIFTKFVHINNIYNKDEHSTGLGLTITRELVKMHKGKITLVSEVKKGTTFRVELGGVVK